MRDWLDVIERGGPLAWIVCAVALLAAVLKSFFAFYKQKSQARKELLELWKGADLSDDFWLETLVRHNYGAFLPASLVRYLVSARSPGSRLARLASNWNWFAYDAPNRVVYWKGIRSAPLVRSVERIACLAVYIVLGILGFLLATGGSGNIQILGLALLAVAVVVLFHGFSLSEAERLFDSIEFADLREQLNGRAEGIGSSSNN